MAFAETGVVVGNPDPDEEEDQEGGDEAVDHTPVYRGNAKDEFPVSD